MVTKTTKKTAKKKAKKTAVEKPAKNLSRAELRAQSQRNR